MNCNINVDRIPDVSEIEELKEGVCPVNWAKVCVDMAREANCGKSIMCRDGLTQVGLIINDVVSGMGTQDDIPLIRELCELIASTGGCELAEKTANNVLYTLDKYADEWDQHCRRKRCAALVCKTYYSVYCIPDKCQGCGKCIENCPAGAIRGGNGMTCVVDDTKCIRCGKCFEVCPHQARGKYGAVKPRIPADPVPVGSISSDAPQPRRRRRPISS